MLLISFHSVARVANPHKFNSLPLIVLYRRLLHVSAILCPSSPPIPIPKQSLPKQNTSIKESCHFFIILNQCLLQVACKLNDLNQIKWMSVHLESTYRLLSVTAAEAGLNLVNLHRIKNLVQTRYKMLVAGKIILFI